MHKVVQDLIEYYERVFPEENWRGPYKLKLVPSGDGRVYIQLDKEEDTCRQSK